MVFCDTSIEFPGILKNVEKVKSYAENNGFKFTTLRAEHDFKYYMLEYTPERRYKDGLGKGLSWPGMKERWCTGFLKDRVVRNYIKSLKEHYNVIQLIGLAADEENRIQRKNNQQANHRHPLYDWGWTEKDCLQYCYDHGYDFDGLYNIFPRVSCWLCPLQSLNSLRDLRKHFPDLWEELKQLDKSTWRRFRNDYSVEDLEKRFQFEEEWQKMGKQIKGKEFYTKLRKVIREK